MAELLIRTIEIACPPDHAFAVFTDRIDLWWPRGHRRHREGSLRLETTPGGALIDRSPDGSEWTMGRVTGIAPPSRLDLDWFPGSGAMPTAVEVRFAPTAAGTTITVTHRPLPDTRAIWPQRVETFAKGWDAVLPALRTFIEEN